MLGMGQADEFQRRVRSVNRALLGGGKHAFDRKVNVVEAAHPREQRVALKNNGSIRPRSTYFTLSQHQHALRRLQQTRNQIQQRRLAAARMPDQETNSPRAIVRSMSRSATNGPRLVANVIPTPWTCRNRSSWPPISCDLIES